MPTHQELDERSRAMHCLVVEKIRHNPALFDQAKATLERWRTTVCAASQPYLDEWALLMNQGLEDCVAVAVEDSARATALRQASPFSGLLTNAERFAFLKAWKNSHAA